LLGSPTPESTWRSLSRDQLITVRGAYSADCFLHGCELLPPQATADPKYRGKEIELTGFVDEVLFQNFPTVRLEPQTCGLSSVLSLFRKDDLGEVRSLQPGEEVTIRGICGGREAAGARYHLRMDNCRVVYTTAPAPGAPRLDAALLLRE